MNNRIKELVDKIQELKNELQTLIYEQESRLNYTISGKRVEFEKAIQEAHKKLKVSWFYWLFTSSPRNLLSIPFIYALSSVLITLDIGVTTYQHICFRLYGIARVKRSDYFIYDHQHLAYLNIFEKINCLYCSYANGLLSYSREIASRTEQYWCPIKHARKVLDSHIRYTGFIEYGDAEDYESQLEGLRTDIKSLETN